MLNYKLVPTFAIIFCICFGTVENSTANENQQINTPPTISAQQLEARITLSPEEQ